jgi:hypothetical protein
MSDERHRSPVRIPGRDDLHAQVAATADREEDIARASACTADRP